MKEVDVDSIRAHALLRHIDLLKPLMLLDITVVQQADAKLKSLHISPIQVEYFDIAIEEVEMFFPGRLHEVLLPILDMFKFKRPMYGTRVMLVDVLIIVCFFVSAPLSEKAKYLFDWFNVNKTGLMDELEHSNFILRSVHCLRSIKFLGSLDVTSAEAKYMALEARTKYENGEIKFIPGLSIYDFIKWIQKGNECKPVFKFFEILYRLVNMLMAMDSRMVALNLIMDHKRESELHSAPVPDVEDLHCTPSITPVYPTFRDQTTCSFCISDLPPQLSEVFIRYEKIVSVVTPRYELPAPIIQRNMDVAKECVARLEHKCCDKYYLLKFRQKNCLEHRVRSVVKCSHQRVLLKGLEPNSRYLVTVYTLHHVYRTLEISTLEPFGVRTKSEVILVPISNDLGPSFKPTKAPAIPEPTVIEGVTLLPSCLSVQEAESFLYENKTALNSALTVFTGSICSIEDILKEVYLRCAGLQLQDADKFLSPFVAHVYQTLTEQWENQIRTLFGVHFCPVEITPGLFNASKDKQMMYCQTLGPWGAVEIKQQVLSHFVTPLLSQQLEERLEELYQRFACSAAPPVPEWCKGTLRLVNIRSRLSDWKYLQQSSYHRYDQRLNAESLMEYLTDKIERDALKSDLCEHLVIVLSSPMDLLDADYGSNANVNDALGQPQSAKMNKLPTEVSEKEEIDMGEEKVKAVSVAPAPALRGKHELLHGEYNNNRLIKTEEPIKKTVKPVKLVAPGGSFKTSENFDFTFYCIVRLLFEWLRGGDAILTSSDSIQDAAIRGRRVTLVSSAWLAGHNFLLINSSDDPQNPVKHAIKHECLLATQLDDLVLPSSSDSDKLVSRMQASIASTVKLHKVATTPLRAMKCSSDDPEHNINFIPIDERFHAAPPDFSAIESVPVPLQVIQGPKLLKVGTREVKFSVDTVGCGEITCTLFEVPTYLTSTDCEGILLADREALLVKRIEKRSAESKQTMVFVWKDLTPYCSYCVLVEPFYCMPLMARFTTLTLEKSLVNSILLTSFSQLDGFQRTERMKKVMKLSQTPRGPPCSVVALFDQKLRFMTNTEAIAQAEVHFAHRYCNFIHTVPSEVFELHAMHPHLKVNPAAAPVSNLSYYSDDGSFKAAFDSVYVLMDGLFCYLTPRTESVESLKELIKSVQYLSSKPGLDVRCLVLFVSRPLVVYKRRNTLHNKWIMDGPLENHPEVCLELWRVLLEWKCAKDGRDCKVVCLDDIKTSKCFKVKNIHPPADNVENNASNKPSLQPVRRQFANGAMLTRDYHHPSDSKGWSVFHGEDGISRPFSLNGPRRATASVNSLHLPDGAFVQHIVLPAKRYIPPEKEGEDTETITSSLQSLDSIPPDDSDKECVLFPEDDEYPLGDDLWCESIHHGTGKVNQIHEVTLRSHLSDLNTEEVVENDENIMYRLEFVLRHVDDSLNWTSSKSDAVHKVEAENVDDDTQEEHNHAVIIRSILNEIDLIEIAAGPIIGIVTQTEAKILLEVSKDVKYMTCVLSPVGVADEEPILMEVAQVKAYQLVSYQFSNLIANTLYNITFPCLMGSQILGRFRTAPSFPSFVEIAVCGQNAFVHQPIVPNVLRQINQQQTPQLLEVSLLNDHMFDDESYLCTRKAEVNMWKHLSDHLKQPGAGTVIVFHIGAQSMLSVHLTELLQTLLDKARLLQLPVREANIIGAWRFKQFEEEVKDTLRSFWRSPFVKDVLSLCSNVPLYHSLYLLPLSRVLDEKLVKSVTESEENTLMLQILRKVFDSYVNQYISSLCNWDLNEVTHTVNWRVDSLVVIAVDNVTNRRKVKRRDGSVTEDLFESVGGPTISDKPVVKGKDYMFSEGFLDKAQWKSLCSLTLDSTISQIILIMEQPLIPLTAIPTTYTAPDVLNKGETYQWAPTVDDLEIFIKVWMDWLQMHEDGKVASCRTLIVISACDTPYATVIQDIHSGLKIHQMCVGNFFGSRTDAAKVQIPTEDIVSHGKIGPYRYSHRLSDQDHFMVDPLRGEASSGSNAIVSDSVLAKLQAEVNGSLGGVAPVTEEHPIPGYSLLKVWMDSWKALGVWSTPVLKEGKAATEADDEAVLIVGPILGAPRRVAEAVDGKPDIQRLYFPILVEVDRQASIKIVARSLFDGHELTMTHDIKPRRPYVIDFGPLNIETRYDVCIVSGLMHSTLNSFSINTHFSIIESNIVVINCHDFTTAKPSAHFVVDIAKRCKVPFNGITTVLHTNFLPSCEKVIQEVINDPILVKKCARCKVERQIKPELRLLLIKIMETIREKYRSALSKPSYRELLRSSYNLMMQNIDSVKIMEEPSQDDDNIEQTKNLLYLMIARINQEYFDKLMYPQWNVHRAFTFNNNKPRMVNIERFEPFDPYVSPVAAAAAAAAEAQAALDATKVESSEPPAPLPPAEVIGSNGLPIPGSAAVVAPTTQGPSGSENPTDTAAQAPPPPPAVQLTPLQEYRELLKTDCRVRTKSNRVGGIGVDIIWSVEDAAEEAFDAVFNQWINDLSPAPHKWKPWLTPNTKVVIEQLPALTEESMNNIIVPQVKSSPLEYGFRVLVINDSIDNDGAGDEMLLPESDLGANLQSLIFEWTNARIDNGCILVCPSSQRGTKSMSCEFTSQPEKANEIYFLDTIYHCNEFERIETQAERERKSVKVLSTAAAKSKRAQKKKEEDERQRREEIQKEIEDMLASETPDGYLVIECRTAEIEVPFGQTTDTITLSKSTIVGSLFGSPEDRAIVYEDILTGLPTYHDHVMLPEWFLKFSPGIDGVFIEDEVLLIMRQHKRVRQVLDFIEEGDMIPRIKELYETSRLSELSRPLDLREVNMDKPGVVPMFVQDLVGRIWRDVIPSKIKPFMFNMCDTFMRSYCFSRAMTGLDDLSSSTAFAKSFMYALKLSVALKTGYEMSSSPEHQYILALPDHVRVQVAKIEHRAAYDAAEYAKEQQRNAIIQAAKEDAEIKGMLYDPAVEAEIVPSTLQAVGYVAESDIESDLDELDNELGSIMKKKLEQEEEEARQAAADDEVMSGAQGTIENREKKAETLDLGEMNDEAMAELEQLRLQWLEEALTKTIEDVMELLFSEGLDLAISMIEHKYDVKVLTEEERISMATTHFINVLTENVKNRRMLGQRIGFMS